LPYPNCQQYSWSFLEYSPVVSEEAVFLFTSGSTAFTKTAGFGGVIAAIVVVGVAVPLVLFLYFSKKACFKATNSSV